MSIPTEEEKTRPTNAGDVAFAVSELIFDTARVLIAASGQLGIDEALAMAKDSSKEPGATLAQRRVDAAMALQRWLTQILDTLIPGDSPIV